MSIRFVAPARRDSKEDARWYEQRELGLGHRFLDEVRRALQRIVAAPESHPKEVSARWQRTIRRCPVGVFPYQVIFEIRPDELVVLAVAHGSRRPGYWSRRKG
jgi:hypothetical protein